MSETMDSGKFRKWALSEPDEYKYMPDEFKDFHDQKDLFKEIFGAYKSLEDQKINWVDAHCFVVDIFLWHLARKGYTLQKCRAKVFKKEQSR